MTENSKRSEDCSSLENGGSITTLKTPLLLKRRNFLKYSILGACGCIAMCVGIKRARWQSIIVHHSGGNFGNVTFLESVHRERQPNDLINSMAYHFIIGNGNGLAMGEVAHGLRWQKQLWGAHVSARNRGFNLTGIGVCLIGNYHLGPIPERQYRALIDLIRQLRASCAIALNQVYAHCRLKGERTVCPGDFFPHDRFRRDIV